MSWPNFNIIINTFIFSLSRCSLLPSLLSEHFLSCGSMQCLRWLGYTEFVKIIKNKITQEEFDWPYTGVQISRLDLIFCLTTFRNVPDICTHYANQQQRSLSSLMQNNQAVSQNQVWRASATCSQWCWEPLSSHLLTSVSIVLW